MSIGKRIKYLREEAELTQEELAKELGIVRSTLACYETDKHQIDIKTLILLAKFFNVRADFILELED